VKHIDLAKFEQLVRRGARTLAQYADLVESLGFDEASRVDLVDLLQLELDDDAKAAAERKRAETTLKAQGALARADPPRRDYRRRVRGRLQPVPRAEPISRRTRSSC
jgi:hypothetical protein